MGRFKFLSGSALKIIAVAAMICDHAAKYLLAPLSLIDKPVYMIMVCGFGRVAFPLFAFLLVEGYLHTRSVGRYALNLAVFALITTVPWNLVHGGLLDFSRLNVLFTLLLGLLAIWGIDRLKGWRSFAVVSSAFVLAYVFRCDYNIRGVLTVVLLYALSGRREFQALSVAACLFTGKKTAGTLLALPLILMYNGKRGFIRGKAWKYAFYSIYPLHLLLIWLLSKVPLIS